MNVMTNPPTMIPERSHKVRQSVLGALIGAIPGLVLMAVNLLFVSGEALLTVGVGAIFLTVGGAVAGAILGTQGGAPGRTILGAYIGGLCGVLAFVTPGFTRLAPLAVIAGAVAGGMIAGQRRQTTPPPPPPPPAST